ncbi:hypothetical protein G6F43_007752 [Rhizopus delemar]|nr:hypothetical protein G6F43_007752 [Rhizopus delemar]
MRIRTGETRSLSNTSFSKTAQKSEYLKTFIIDTDETKLLLGAKTFNALTTSSPQLDQSIIPENGPTTNMMLEIPKKSQSICLLVKESSKEVASLLDRDPDCHLTANYGCFYHLR